MGLERGVGGWGSEAHLPADAVPSACGLLWRRKAVVWRLRHRWEMVYGLLVDGVIYICQGTETRKGDAYPLACAAVRIEHKPAKKTRAHTFPAPPPTFYVNAKVPGAEKLSLRVETQEAVDYWLKALCGTAPNHHKPTLPTSLSHVSPAAAQRALASATPVVSFYATDASTYLLTDATSNDLTYESEDQLLATACSMSSMRSAPSHDTQNSVLSGSHRSRPIVSHSKLAVATTRSGELWESRHALLVPPAKARSSLPPTATRTHTQTTPTCGATTWAKMKEELGRAFMQRESRRAILPPTPTAASSQPDPVVDVGLRRRFWPASHSHAGADGRPSSAVQLPLPPPPTSIPSHAVSSKQPATPVSSSRLSPDLIPIVCKC